MTQMGLWQITGGGPRALQPAAVDLEAQLEAWIEQDPDLLQRGLTVVGRQVHVDGGILDLLAVDPQGNWVIIEIKRGTVYRETITQALDYTASIATMPYAALAEKVRANLRARGKDPALLDGLGVGEAASSASRDVSIFVVGTGKAPDLDRIVDFLASRFDMPIGVVTYEVFVLASGEQVLLRELTEADEETVRVPDTTRTSLDDLVAVARSNGIGSQVGQLLQAAETHGFYPRPYKRSIMFTPPNQRTRMLFTIRLEPTADGRVRMYTGPEAFEEFYGIPAADTAAKIGKSGWQELTADGIRAFVEGLRQLFAGRQQGQDLKA